MALTSSQQSAIEEIISLILAATGPRKRQIAAMFLVLVDKNDWPQYYEIIPEPRCLNLIKAGVEKKKYKDALEVYTDLSLVFWNAVFYNEVGSQIAVDAVALKKILDTEWKKRTVLPTPRYASPPPRSAQKVHGNPPELEPPQPASASASSSTPAMAPPRKQTVLIPPQVQIATTAAAAAMTTTPTPTPTPTPTQAQTAQTKHIPIRPKQQHQQQQQRSLDLQDMDVDIDGSPSPDTDGGDSSYGSGGGGGGNAMAMAMAAGGSASAHVRAGSGPRLSITMTATSSSGPGPGQGKDRDPHADEVVQKVEVRMETWPGFGERGWAEDLSPDRIRSILGALKNHRDANGVRVAETLEMLPEDSASVPHLSYSFPHSFTLIEARARTNGYASKDFDLAMAHLFEKGRKIYKPTTEPYGRVLLLQRLYQALSSATPPPGPPYVSATHFAALRAGPGNAKLVAGASGANDIGAGGLVEGDELVTGVTSFRVSSKDRTFVDELHYKGWMLKLADWVHLCNPDDPSRPIVGQVFRSWVSDEPAKKGQQGITVAWYYRPEQTWHPADRQFWSGEVFKTSHFADHPLSDLVEKIACQFTARHIRGRPKAPYWYPGFPLYVCDSRYHDPRDKGHDKEKPLAAFVKIKNWNSCVPEEVRKSTEFMQIEPFERTVFPERLSSPFLSEFGPQGPGGLVEGPPTSAQPPGIVTPGGGPNSSMSIAEAGASVSAGATPGPGGGEADDSIARSRPRRAAAANVNYAAIGSPSPTLHASALAPAVADLQKRTGTPSGAGVGAGAGSAAGVGVMGTMSYAAAATVNAGGQVGVAPYGSGAAVGTPARAVNGAYYGSAANMNMATAAGAVPYGANATMAPAANQQHYQQGQQQTQYQQQYQYRAQQAAIGAGSDRSVITATGVSVNNLLVEKLSPEIVKHCERDPDTGEVLWFAAPPVNVARAAQAKHSLTYLHYLAERKRKREEEEEEGKELGKDGDRDGIDGTTGEEEEGGEDGEGAGAGAGAGASGNGERKRRITMVEVLRGISPLSLAT